MVERSGSVSLQPIEVTSPLHESVGSAERLLQNLALPIVVVVFAALFQLFDRTRNERSEVWKEQLARLFKYTKKYYLNISTNIGALDRSSKENPPPIDRMFFHFVMLWVRLSKLSSDKGGWFLSTREGEKVLSTGLKLLAANVREHLGPARDGDIMMHRVVDILNRESLSMPDFTMRLAAGNTESADLKGVSDQFKAWVGDPDGSFTEALALLVAIRTVLNYEWDRPFYRYWYREKPQFDSKSYRETLDTVPHSPDHAYRAFDTAARQYSPSRSAISRFFGSASRPTG